MKQDRKDAAPGKSAMAPGYADGSYFADAQRHQEDASFKAQNFLKLFQRYSESHDVVVNSWVDVGCGSGHVVKLIADSLGAGASITFKGYDVSPHVAELRHEGVEYIHGDFSETDEFVDVITLFDVFEHVPDTVTFIKQIAQHGRIVGFHIPLDSSLSFAMRDRFRSSLRNPGHLLFLDTASALNLLALAGLRVVDYAYTFAFLAPSGHRTLFSKIAFPVRYLLAKLSPWLLSKTLGGTSLMVLARTPHEVRDPGLD